MKEKPRYKIDMRIIITYYRSQVMIFVNWSRETQQLVQAVNDWIFLFYIDQMLVCGILRFVYTSVIYFFIPIKLELRWEQSHPDTSKIIFYLTISPLYVNRKIGSFCKLTAYEGMQLVWGVREQSALPSEHI